MPCYYARPSDNIIASATISLTVGAVDTNYPLTNIQDGIPAKPAKTTGTAATFRATYGVAQTLEMTSFGPHNLAGATVTLTNNAGFSQVITVPANREDGLSINPFLDFSTLANRTATQWNLVISGASANIAIGEWQLITTRRTLQLLWGLKDTETHRTIIHPTDYDAKLKYWMGTAQRHFIGRVNRETNRADILSLIRSAQGQYQGFVLVPESTVNEAFLVDLTTDERTFTRIHHNASDVELEFCEIQRGLAL